MRIIVVIFLVFYSCNVLSGQEKNATQHIQELRNGMLLVRLKSGTQRKMVLEQRGMFEKAKAVVEQQTQENQNLIMAFARHFSFCPVYFFYSDRNHFVTNGILDSVIFFNAALQEVSIPNASHTPYKIAGIGMKENEDAAYNSGNSLDGLIIYDEKGKQLKSPFPFFHRTFSSHPKWKALSSAVGSLNRKLSDFEKKLTVKF